MRRNLVIILLAIGLSACGGGGGGTKRSTVTSTPSGEELARGSDDILTGQKSGLQQVAFTSVANQDGSGPDQVSEPAILGLTAAMGAAGILVGTRRRRRK